METSQFSAPSPSVLHDFTTSRLSSAVISYVDATGTAGGRIITDSAGWGAKGTEYAVTFTSLDGTLQPGDMVTIDHDHPGSVVKASATTRNDLVGAVSSRPGFLTGIEEGDGRFAISIGGQAPVKVSLENGPIAVGDALIPSSQPGVAMRATSTGVALGTALEPLADGSTSTTITALIRVGWIGASDLAGSSDQEAGSGSGGSGSARSGLATIYAGDKAVTVTFESVGAYPAVHVTPYGIPTGSVGVIQVTDKSFQILTSEAQASDITFAWSADVLPVGGKIDFSDGTSALYDQTTGQPLPQASGPASAVVSSSSTAVSTDVTSSTVSSLGDPLLISQTPP
jgi:hypothetical protein